MILVFLIFSFLMLSPETNARELDAAEGLPPPPYTDPIPEHGVDRRVAGGMDSFSGESSGNTNSCGSCGG